MTGNENGIPTADVAGLLDAIGRYWRLLLAVPLALAFIVGLLSYLIPRSYKATVLFLPERGGGSQGLSGALAGVAGQFGIQLGGEGGQAVGLYPEVARSRSLLVRLLWTPFHEDTAQAARPLIDWLVPAQSDSVQREARALRELLKGIETQADLQTGLVRVSLHAPSPGVAAAATNMLEAYIGDFNLKTRQTKGRLRREFVERRASEVERNLDEAEEAMRSFLERNRSVQSPALAYERMRLQRQIDIYQQVYLTLARELESARIEEVNDTPMLTVVDPAVPPLKAARPKRLFLVVTAWMIGVLAVITGIAILENLRRRAAVGDFRAEEISRRVEQFLRSVRGIPRSPTRL